MNILNDCLRAGLVYRREFYNDSELEPENSLMFKITLTPFGNINSPSFKQLMKIKFKFFIYIFNFFKIICKLSK